MTLRLKKRGEKALERALVVSSPEDDPTNVMSKWKGYPEEDSIPEGEEPPSGVPHPSPQLRRREMADTR
jgi:PH/SEC7 domain-containing protein